MKSPVRNALIALTLAVAAALLMVTVSPSSRSLAQTTGQQSWAATLTCTADSSGYCIVTHPAGVVPDAVIVTPAAAAIVSVDQLTAGTFRIRFVRTIGASSVTPLTGVRAFSVVVYWTPGVPSPSPSASASPSPSPSPTPGPGLNLPRIAWEDPGTYWQRFPKTAAAGWSDPNFFPVGVWLHDADDQARVDQDKAAGINTYVGVADPEGSNLALLVPNGAHAIIQSDERTRFPAIGDETVGWLLYDEVDMCCGPPGFAGGNGYDMLSSILAGLPQGDGRARYNNYGKGVEQWETDTQAAQFVNGPAASGPNSYQQVTSDDQYWYTDPNEIGTPSYGHSSGYGATVDRIRHLDGLDGVLQPTWNFIEDGWPATETASQGGRAISPQQLAGAVWNSLIHEARGIVYFDHSFGGPCQAGVIRGGCYPDTLATMKTVNAQVKALAPVLNTQSYQWSFAPGVDSMLKSAGGFAYVFAMLKTPTCTSVCNSTQTFTLPAGIAGTQVEVLNEGRTVPVVGGKFADTFAAEYSSHVYKVSIS